MEPLYRIETLGRFAVRQGRREITRFRTRKTAALLGCLALAKGASHPRDALVERFWPESDLAAARTNLSVALNALRRQLEPPGIPYGAVLAADHTCVRLNPAAFCTDVEEFEAACRRASGEADPGGRAAAWEAAAGFYGGDLLPGWHDDWVLEERNRLRDMFLAALRQAMRARADLRQLDRALEHAHRLVREDPLREDAHRDLMRLYAALRRPQEALRQYQVLERTLASELGEQPSTATRDLAEQIRASVSPARPRPARTAAVEQCPTTAVEAEDPLKQHDRPPLRVPPQFTRFFGRENEIARIVSFLTSHLPGPAPHAPRLLTLTGPGGSGKTRLSIEAALRAQPSFPGGVWFVELADVEDPLRVAEAIRDRLDLPRLPDGSAVDQVCAHMASRPGRSLLILDNLEQVVAGSAQVVWTLLSRSSDLWCLATSRQPLSLPGEQLLPVPPLPIPGLDEGGVPAGRADPAAVERLLEFPSVALFVDRAQAARPDFQITGHNAGAIAALCARLEGIPLALELAAARSGSLAPQQILERLQERFDLLATRRADKGDRHRSLWAAIDWSCRLLAPEVRRFFAALSVFRGGWTLEAAEAVCREPQALQHLEQLRAHSLVQAADSAVSLRFRMLESIREFADDLLDPQERARVEDRHARHFHQWVMGAQLAGRAQLEWYGRWEEDLSNLRAVLAWSLRQGGDVEVGLQTAGALVVFWRVRGHLPEAMRWCDQLLQCAGDRRTPGLCRVLYCAGALKSLLGEFGAARPLLERCVDVARDLGDSSTLAVGTNELGTMAYRLGDYEEARARYEQYLALSREQGSRPRVASALCNLASLAQATGDFGRSRALFGESLSLWRELSDGYGEARTLNNLGNLALSQGDLEEAAECYERALAIRRELVDDYGACHTLLGLARLARGRGDLAGSVKAVRRGLELARRQAMRANLVDVLQFLAETAQEAGLAGESAGAFGALDRIRQEMRYPLPPVERAEHSERLDRLRDVLGCAEFESAWSAGRSLTLEESLARLDARLSVPAV